MLKRSLGIKAIYKYIYIWNEFLPGHKVFTKSGSLTGSRDITMLYQKTKFDFNFTSQEEIFCKEWLLNKGWKITQPFICLIVRDDAFHSNLSNDKILSSI